MELFQKFTKSSDQQSQTRNDLKFLKLTKRLISVFKLKQRLKLFWKKDVKLQNVIKYQRGKNEIFAVIIIVNKDLFQTKISKMLQQKIK